MEILINGKKYLHLNSKFKSLIFIAFLLTSISIITFLTVPVCACHSVGTYESDYETPKTIFMQGETVYGKETYHDAQHLKLRIRDPDDNVVFTSDPVYSQVITCAYKLDDNATIGKWNIQVGLFIEGTWNWLIELGDISYFDVIEPTKYSLEVDIVGSGNVEVSPDQVSYTIDTIVSLTAIPETGWKFDHWNGDLSGSSNPITINMDSDKVVTANFVRKDNGGGSPVSGGSTNGGVVVEYQVNIPPVAVIEDFNEEFVDSEILFDGSQSYDNDGYITEWHWDFGDGTSDEGMTVFHSYSNTGDYTVFLEVIDDQGEINHSEVTIVVNQPNRSPSAPKINGPIEVKKGENYGYIISSTDEDDDLIKYTINWGDGDTEVSGWLLSGEEFIVKHNWKSTGSFTIKVKADDGKLDSSAELSVKVLKVEPGSSISPLLFFLFIPFIIPLFFVFRKKNTDKKE